MAIRRLFPPPKDSEHESITRIANAICNWFHYHGKQCEKSDVSFYIRFFFGVIYYRFVWTANDEKKPTWHNCNFCAIAVCFCLIVVFVWLPFARNAVYSFHFPLVWLVPLMVPTAFAIHLWWSKQQITASNMIFTFDSSKRRIKQYNCKRIYSN